MPGKEIQPDDTPDLKLRADATARADADPVPENIGSLSPEEIRRTLHELRVHQIELELQNEELRRTQRELEESQALYVDLYDFAPVGYCTLSEEGLILKANLTIASLLGMPRSSLARAPLSRFIVPASEDLYYHHRKHLLETGTPQACELQMLRRDATPFWARVEATAGQDAGDTPVCHLVMSDITERKLAEAEKEKLQGQLAQSQKMESIGRLAGGIAHEFNNQLTVINGYSHLALRQMLPGNPQFQNLTEILLAGQRSANLVGQLLAFSRKQVLQPEVLSVNVTVSNMAHMLRRLVGDDIEVVVHLDPAIAPVEADRHQVERMVMNLVANARDAMPGGGTLTLETGEQHWEEGSHSGREPSHAGRYVGLTVRDTGIGMDKQTLAQLFEPFFTTKGVGKGTGLGLSTVQGIAMQSGGHVVVESEPGRGSSFHVYLPATTRTGEPPEQVRPAGVKNGTETILLVEDQEQVRQFIALTLRHYGYRVVAAKDAADALRHCAEHPVDALITDVVMPKMNGVELAKRIRLLLPGLKTLFISGYAEGTQEGIWDSAEEGAFLQKPFTPDSLAGKIRQMLDAGRAGKAARAGWQ